MNRYNIIACYGNDGRDWRIIKTMTTTFNNAIEFAKQEYLIGKWDNVAVERADCKVATKVLWDAGHDKISNYAWD